MISEEDLSTKYLIHSDWTKSPRGKYYRLMGLVWLIENEGLSMIDKQCADLEAHLYTPLRHLKTNDV